LLIGGYILPKTATIFKLSYMRSSIIPYAFLFLILFVIGCQKAVTDPESSDNATNSANTNARLSYGDTLFFLKNQVADYTILPVSKPNAPGYLKSIPKGLVLDSINGRINVTKSQTGLRYKVYYVATNGTILDSVKLVISGVDYRDAIYEIASTPNAYDTAFPIYNARPELVLPCGDDDEDDDGDIDDDDNACVFDETDLNNDGNDDIAGVIQDKLLIDEKKGTIDVEASFHAGVFGSSNPANGVSKDFTFYYRLQDASNRALNKMTVRLYHFRKRSDIPQSLLDTLRLRAGVSAAVNSRTGIAVNAFPQADDASQRNTNFSRLEFYYKPKRPPFIIIVSQ
jgi:hypothetical protein